MKKTLLLCLGSLFFGQLMADDVIKLSDGRMIKDYMGITFDPAMNGNIRIFFDEENFISVNMNNLLVLPSSDPVVGDVNGDHLIDKADVKSLAAIISSDKQDEAADLNSDKVITVRDLVLLINNFNKEENPDQ